MCTNEKMIEMEFSYLINVNDNSTGKWLPEKIKRAHSPSPGIKSNPIIGQVT